MFIIAKYADPDYREYTYGKDYIFTSKDNASNTYTGKQVGLPATIYIRFEANQWLRRMKALNPSVGYAVIEVSK